MWYSHFLDSERELSIFAPMFMENQWYMINDVLWWLILVINVVNTISRNSPCCVWVLWAIPKWYVSLLGFLQYIYMYIYICWLVVSTILKNMKVNGKDYLIYYGKQKLVETTNQYMCIHIQTICWYFDVIFSSTYIYIYIRNRSLSRVVEAEYCHTVISLINSVVSIRLK